MRFVLLDLSNGAKCSDGTSLDPAMLAHLAEAYTVQLNREYAAEYGGNHWVRAGSGPTDLQSGEYPFAFLPTLTDAPGAVAYHTVNGNGMPLLFDGVTLSDTVNGPGNSASVAGSHELLETAQDEGTNLWCDDGAGTEHAREIGDPFENQAYPIDCQDGTKVWVSNFATRAFFIPDRSGPYSYMASAGLTGVVDAPSPLVTAAGQGYQMTRVYDPQSEHAVNGYRVVVQGEMRRRPSAHEGSRKHRRGLR